MKQVDEEFLELHCNNVDNFKECKCKELIELIREATEDPYNINFCPKCKWEDVDFKKYCEPCKFELKEGKK